MLAFMFQSTTSDRIAGLKAEIKEFRPANLRYWAQTQRSALDKTAHALRRARLLTIMEELGEMMKRVR
jgi:hypothetical protein